MDWSNPLTPEQIVAIEPKLHVIACRFSKSEADRLDLVQVAYVALLDGKRKWTNPLVCAYSAMLDHYRHINLHNPVYFDMEDSENFDIGYEEDFNYPENEILEDKEFRSLKWLDIDITDKERELAVYYWVDGYSQTKIASILKVSASTVSNQLAKIKEKIKNKFKRSFS